MAKSNDSIQKTFLVAFLLCIVCSVVVSMAAVQLRPAQEKNEELYFKRNILQAAGLMEEGKSVEALFEKIEERIVDLDSGTFTDEFDPSQFDQQKVAKNSELSKSLDKAEDIANIGRRENFAKVYLVRGASGEVEKIILPIKGYGLWSVLYGFVAIEADLNTVVGLGYYEHGETAGLGGEVDNPKWKNLWPGKEVYGDQGNVAIAVVKGTVDANDTVAKHKVDGLSGATLTSNGVTNMLQFWMGELGYSKFLQNFREGNA